ncbi:MAG: ATP-binding cassette domain-containing protein, partial [Pseudomonadota bacterium]|nr:ATP-binding cassette domain-containing protein [Pseudomonadota bacterium]
MKTLLELKNIEVSFKTRHGVLKAVDDLSLTVQEGEILGIVGESGAGKSMTGAAIIGLIDPPGRLSAGEIWFGDERVDEQPERLRGREISMIFQDPLTSLNPLRTVGDQLVETILAHMPVSKEEAEQRALDGLAEVPAGYTEGPELGGISGELGDPFEPSNETGSGPGITSA